MSTHPDVQSLLEVTQWKTRGPAWLGMSQTNSWHQVPCLQTKLVCWGDYGRGLLDFWESSHVPCCAHSTDCCHGVVRIWLLVSDSSQKSSKLHGC
jgi:hypothetical protein